MPVLITVEVPQYLINKHRPKPAGYKQRVPIRVFEESVWSPERDCHPLIAVTIDYITVRFNCRCISGFTQARVAGEAPAVCPKCSAVEACR